MTKLYPAPWNLKGNGYIFIYHFSKKLIGRPSFSNDFISDPSFSGLGTVMLVDYFESTAGPYRELLFVPGKFRFNDKKLYSITKIFVSTMESVLNGRKNWGIPKELAEFTFDRLDRRRERITVKKDGILVFDVTVKQTWLQYPISTHVMPLPLVQKFNGRIYYTQFHGSGRGRLARVESIYVNKEMFPDIETVKPLYVKRVENFHITFPVPQIKE
jgi:hypothetical protein